MVLFLFFVMLSTGCGELECHFAALPEDKGFSAEILHVSHILCCVVYL